MAKIFLIGDTHIALGYPNKADAWYKVHEEYFNSFLIPLLKREVADGDIIVHLGDLFDNRNIIPINLLVFGMEKVEEIANIAPLHIILGNHDCWHKSSSDINTIRPFKYIPNVSVWEKTGVLDFFGKRILMMPFIEKRSEQIDLITKNKTCDYLFCHSDLNGAKMHLTSVAHKNSDKIDIDEFKFFRKVYSGHIHILDRHKNFTFVGNNFQMDRNDFGNQKGIFAIDVDTDKEYFWENNISPIFQKIHILEEDDMYRLEGINTKNWIDLFISNKLLVNNRKLRRKLESVLQNGKFSSISYIDDISSQSEDVSGEISESVSINANDLPQFQLDFKEIIEEYIKSQRYDDKIKFGILGEYNEIIRLYQENYKD